MDKQLKLAYHQGAQQALRDLGLDKTAAALPGPGFLHRLGLPGVAGLRGPIGHLPFLPRGSGQGGALSNLFGDLGEGGISGLGHVGDLGLVAAATGAMSSDD